MVVAEGEEEDWKVGGIEMEAPTLETTEGFSDAVGTSLLGADAKLDGASDDDG